MKWKDDKGTFMQAFQALDYFGLNKLLEGNQDRVDKEFRHRLSYLKFSSILKTITQPLDKIFYGKEIASTKLAGDPVFLLGHWRSGTTFLHNLLSRDTRFTCPTLAQVFTPHSFLTLGKPTAAYLDMVLPETRAMDQVILGSQEPQEDEFAIAIMSNISPYFATVFPRERDKYIRFLRMKDVSEDELSRWKDAFMTFLKKITIVNNKIILLKSPTHTARVSLLNDMFPEAKFIHIVRNPYDVYTSMWKLYENYTSMQHLQVISKEDSKKDILRNYKEMFEAFEEEKQLVPKNRLITLKYEDLIQNPLKTLELVYNQLEFGDFGNFNHKAAEYLDSIKDYIPNKTCRIPSEELEQINIFCHQVFDVYGYEKAHTK